MRRIESGLKTILIDKFKRAGSDYLVYKMKQKGIYDLDSLKVYEQQRFIVELVHDLYAEMIPHKRYKDIILTVFNKLYGFSEAEHAVMWNDFFRGLPPVGFMEDFFGVDIGKNLIMIEQNRTGIIDIQKEEDAIQFSFVMSTINRIFEGQISLIKDLKSTFIKYLVHGKDNIKIDFKDFMSGHIEYIEKATFSFRNYLLKNANEDNIDNVKYLYNMNDIFGDKKKNFPDIKGVDDSEGAYLFKRTEKSIREELARYMDIAEVKKVIGEAKRIAGFDKFSNAKKDQKIKFMNHIIYNTKIMTFSEQKERMVKLWLMRTLRL